ncbi:MAG: dockerin type I repeat-containing protein [Ruminococcus sp.]|nr:dockerin type I repeat-containing protein [Ruminococcus sp.]
MKTNKPFSVLISLVLMLTALLPVTVSAEETESIFDAYTYEEFLALSSEEVCAISEQAAGRYEAGVSYYEMLDANFTEPSAYSVFFAIEDVYADLTESAAELLKIPSHYIESFEKTSSTINEVPSYSGSFYLNVNAEHAPADVLGKSFVWFELNPCIAHTMPSMFNSTGPADTTTALPADTVIQGDINLDGRLSVVDVITISKYNAKMITLNAMQELACDCNGDSVVDDEDVIDLMKYIVGMHDSLPNG